MQLLVVVPSLTPDGYNGFCMMLCSYHVVVPSLTPDGYNKLPL